MATRGWIVLDRKLTTEVHKSLSGETVPGQLVAREVLHPPERDADDKVLGCKTDVGEFQDGRNLARRAYKYGLC